MIRAILGCIAIAACSWGHAAPVRIPLYGDIEEGTAMKVAAAIQEVNAVKTTDPIYLLISSPGGSISSGGLIVDAMMASRRPVNTICISYCASMAAWIHQHGQKRYMFPHATLMLHQASFAINESAPRIAERAKAVERASIKFEQVVADRTGRTLKEVKDKEANGWWLDSEEALKEKLIDAIIVSTISKP